MKSLPKLLQLYEMARGPGSGKLGMLDWASQQTKPFTARQLHDKFLEYGGTSPRGSWQSNILKSIIAGNGEEPSASKPLYVYSGGKQGLGGEAYYAWGLNSPLRKQDPNRPAIPSTNASLNPLNIAKTKLKNALGLDYYEFLIKKWEKEKDFDSASTDIAKMRAPLQASAYKVVGSIMHGQKVLDEPAPKEAPWPTPSAKSKEERPTGVFSRKKGASAFMNTTADKMGQKKSGDPYADMSPEQIAIINAKARARAAREQEPEIEPESDDDDEGIPGGRTIPNEDDKPVGKKSALAQATGQEEPESDDDDEGIPGGRTIPNEDEEIPGYEEFKSKQSNAEEPDASEEESDDAQNEIIQRLTDMGYSEDDIENMSTEDVIGILNGSEDSEEEPDEEPNEDESSDENAEFDEYPAWVPDPDENGSRASAAMYNLVKGTSISAEDPIWAKLKKAKDGTDAKSIISTSESIPKEFASDAIKVAMGIFKLSGRSWDSGEKVKESKLLSVYKLNEEVTDDIIPDPKKRGLIGIFRTLPDYGVDEAQIDPVDFAEKSGLKRAMKGLK